LKRTCKLSSSLSGSMPAMPFIPTNARWKKSYLNYFISKIELILKFPCLEKSVTKNDWRVVIYQKVSKNSVSKIQNKISNSISWFPCTWGIDNLEIHLVIGSTQLREQIEDLVHNVGWSVVKVEWTNKWAVDIVTS
jgi:hypothetical protein